MSPQSEPTDKVWQEYLSTGFGRLHPCTPQEYALYARYYGKNYGPFLPADRGAAILDVGCGPGHFLHYLRSRGYSAYEGIDLSPECVEVCRGQGLAAQQADAFEYLAAHRGALDAIVCNDVLEHMPKERGFRFAEQCRAALKEGGVLIIKVPNSAAPIVGARARYSDITHETGFTAHSLRTLLLISGFRQVDVREPDIYVTRNPLANVAGRAAFCVMSAGFRVLFRLYGIATRELMTKHIFAVARP
jgi:2-polyprenyl-3-methyl-5-hydroxy-6-metoxy-1,4-benzoquinol methylase